MGGLIFKMRSAIEFKTPYASEVMSAIEFKTLHLEIAVTFICVTMFQTAVVLSGHFLSSRDRSKIPFYKGLTLL